MTQETALKVLQTGANVFLTGEPGSGKTHTINQYVRWLRERGIEPAITASTGIAATHVGGMTIHSWSGIGIKKSLSPYELDQISGNERVVKRVSRATTLIIDEISMLGADTLAMTDAVCREVRRNQKPFGGLQLVLVGDFFQLPPITIIRNSENLLTPFAFRSPAWQKAMPLTCYLGEQHRQESGPLLKLLSSIRLGKVNQETDQILKTKKIDPKKVPKDLPQLYSHNEDVDRINEERLEKIPGKIWQFKMTSRGPESMVSTLKRACISPETVSLKIGARVMFTKNSMDGKFVNGTLGEVREFSKNGMPIVRTLSGMKIEVESMDWTITDGLSVLARISQLPLRLAWAITIHKSQGITLDAAVMDLTQTFEYGQGYVALSRVRSLAGLHLLGWNDRALEVHPEISRRDREFKLESAEARKTFEKMAQGDHDKLVHSFITISGGKPEGGVVPEKFKRKTKISTLDVTLALLKNGSNLAETTKSRRLVESTIIAHTIKLYSSGRITKDHLISLISQGLKKALPAIHVAMQNDSEGKLKNIFEKFHGKYSYDDLRLARLLKE